MLGYFGAACVLGIAAIGSAIGIGIAGQAAIGAWNPPQDETSLTLSQ